MRVPTRGSARTAIHLDVLPEEPHETSAAADLELHHRLLAMIARAEPLPETLAAMCAGIEQRYPGAWCSVQLVAGEDEDRLCHVAAPSASPDLVDRLDGLSVGQDGGAWGTAAATGQPVVVSDITTHPLGERFADLWPAHGVRSVWSVPLMGGGRVLGTFALYRHEVHTPDAAERAAVMAAARLGALAVERDRRERALIAAATEDALTGLPNRSAFMQCLNRHLRAEGSDVAVLFLDVDQFKLINDSLGHRSGDVLLVQLAERLRRVVTPPHVVARFGGDEFAVMAVVDDAQAVSRMADLVDTAFADPFCIPGGEFLLTASVGIAVSPAAADPMDADTMVRDADTAMYAAKAQRVGRVVFDGRLRGRVLARVSLENALQRGIAEDEFAVCYQPVVDLRTGRRTSMEALVRWTHPERGPLAPEEFIGLAEETGLIVPLGERVLDIAIRHAAALAHAGRPVTVAVNVSAIQLSDAGFVAHVTQALETHGLDPALLVLELTESVAIARSSAPRRALDALSQRGVRLVIDDFGTGYSSIPLLRDLPVVGLKIDRTFTMAMDADPRMSGVVAAVTDLAHAMDLFVVAEGVDTADALAEVTRLGCDYAQGFHIAQPLPAELL